MVFVLINLTPVQNFLVKSAASFLSRKLKTTATVGAVRFDLLNHVLFNGVYIEDLSHDTLLYAGKIQIRMSDWILGGDRPVLHDLELQNTYAHLYRTPLSKVWNYEFIIDAFDFGNKKDTSKGKKIEIDLKKISLKNVRFSMDDGWMGTSMDYTVGSLQCITGNLDFKNKLIDIDEVSLIGGIVDLKFGKFQPKNDTSSADTPILEYGFKPLNQENWVVKAKKLNLTSCKFILNNGNLPAKKDEFDAEHINISDINLKTTNIKIVGDTIHGSLDNLTAKERCGLVVKALKSKITVSPVVSICENLFLETNNSRLYNYFSMHYAHFPNFLNFIDSVSMTGKLKDAFIDMRDVAYFAPPLRNLPDIKCKVNGDFNGTVASLTANNINLNDGANSLKGGVTIKGLPDIKKSIFNFTGAEFKSSGAGILKYAPSLKDNENLALAQLTNIYFLGDINGYLENFTLKGIINSNLGNISTNFNIDMPDFDMEHAKYSGNIQIDQFQIGTLLKQSDLGVISMRESFTGTSFNPLKAEVNLDGILNDFTFKKYTYHNVYTQGVLAEKKFHGNLKIDDPNLAMVFDGGLDYSSKIVKVNAKSQIFFCNFKEINLFEDLLTASAEFDLNCAGSDFDNFSGYAKFSNMDLRRNKHRLEMDSIYVKSLCDTSNPNEIKKTLTIQGNAIFAKIKGDFKLSQLPASFQYYLASYLPSYIKPPTNTVAKQNLEFLITTTDIDKLLAFAYPQIRGFDTSYISGMLNTTDQKLTLVANIPACSFGKTHLFKTIVSGQGDNNALSLNTTIENVMIGDSSSLNGSVGFTSTLHNDSMNFYFATTTPDTTISIVLNGQVIARHDSLLLNMLPSEFYLNQIKWEIGGDCQAVYCSNYLFLDKLAVTSGLQKISANYEQQGTDQIIVINSENLDLGQLGAWAGLSYLQPDGRIDGTIKILNALSNPVISANIKANNVKLSNEAIGTIKLIGDYKQDGKIVNIDPQTGIYTNDGSITASGKISFDTLSSQTLNGIVKLTNAPCSWATPFVGAIFSKLSGNLDGEVDFKGKSDAPVVNGKIKLSKAGFKLDYLGCNYSMPSSTVHISNKKIEFDSTFIYDERRNVGILTGYFSHDLFKNWAMQLKLETDKFEVLRLAKNDNPYFYGTVIADIDSFTCTGPFNNINLNIYNIVPAAKSHLTIPVNTAADAGLSSYVSFKSYGKTQEKLKKVSANKLNISIDANLNELADITILLDPISGDAIEAKGNGNIQLKMPANNDMRIAGNYNIESGNYIFTFKQLYIKKQFALNSGSTIYFKGPFSETSLDASAVYTAKARLYDLMSTTEQSSFVNTSDITDAKRLQPVDIVLHLKDALFSPKLTFDLNVQDKRMENNPAYVKLMQINTDDRQKFDQVASLLLTGNFISQEGFFGNNTVSTGMNTASQIISGKTSSELTNALSKLIGDRKININVNYQNYDIAGASINRNQFTSSISKNFLDDRLIVEVGGKSDWGHTGASSSSSNITGDFRLQYLLKPDGHLRLNCFSTGDYDVLQDRQIIKNGLGISWKKSFDDFDEFIKPQKKKRSLGGDTAVNKELLNENKKKTEVLPK